MAFQGTQTVHRLQQNSDYSQICHTGHGRSRSPEIIFWIVTIFRNCGGDGPGIGPFLSFKPKIIVLFGHRLNLSPNSTYLNLQSCVQTENVSVSSEERAARSGPRGPAGRNRTHVKINNAIPTWSRCQQRRRSERRIRRQRRRPWGIWCKGRTRWIWW
jgi:hypothetical protein